MESPAGLLVLLVGPSGVGKNAVISRIVNETQGLVFVPSSTTRPMRPGESQGSPYFFLNEADFFQQRDRGEVLEFQAVHGNYYWTAASRFRSIWDRRESAITDIDVLGALRLSALLPHRVLSIYLTAPQPVLEHRIRKRHPRISSKELSDRITRMRFEESLQSAFSARLDNLDLDTTAARCQALIEHLHPVTTPLHELYELQESELSYCGLECQGLCRFGIGREPSLIAAATRQMRAIAYACGTVNTLTIRDCQVLRDALTIELENGYHCTVKRLHLEMTPSHGETSHVR